MQRNPTPIALASALLLALSGGAQAQVYGSLANFDVINNTGSSAYGFEIEIEGSQLYSDAASAYAKSSQSYVDSVFGLNRHFGIGNGPTAVVRFGTVNVVDYDVGGVHAGVRIQYGLAAGQSFTSTSIKTPDFSAVPGFATPGESCWPGANANWLNNPCDHYGVTTTGGAGATRYSWVLDNNGTLTKQLVGIPAVNIVPLPAPAPAPGVPAAAPQVRFEIEAVDDRLNAANWGEAVWVKTFTTKVKDRGRDDGQGNIGLDDLLLHGGQIDGREADTKTRFRLFQKAPDKVVDGVEEIDPLEVMDDRIALGADDKSVIVRYEFYKYTGGYDKKGRADCNGKCLNEAEDSGALVGNFLGRQMAGFNAVQPLAVLAAPVPEPTTWALMAGGLALLLSRSRRLQRTQRGNSGN